MILANGIICFLVACPYKKTYRAPFKTWKIAGYSIRILNLLCKNFSILRIHCNSDPRITRLQKGFMTLNIRLKILTFYFLIYYATLSLFEFDIHAFLYK